MRRSIALAGLFLVGFLGVAAASPGADLGLPVPAITTTSPAQAAIGRGGAGGSEGGQPGVLKRFFALIQSEVAAGFFIAVALGLAVMVGQRNAGAAVGLLVAAFVIGAFLLVPDQVESLFRSVYNYVL